MNTEQQRAATLRKVTDSFFRPAIAWGYLILVLAVAAWTFADPGIPRFVTTATALLSVIATIRVVRDLGYRSESTGIKVVWAILILVFGPLAFLIYFYTRPDNPYPAENPVQSET